LNRFTTDMQQFDMNLGGVVQKSLKMSFCIIITLVSTIVQVPALLVVSLALVPVLLSLQARLSKFLSDAKKINSIWKSPLLTMVNDSENAVSVIRAFGSVQASTTRMNLLQTQQRIAGLTEFAAWLLCR
jgi:ABC-type multidrug transport system fused ATPase/permease subunit